MLPGRDIPDIPEYNITRLNFREVHLPTGGKGMSADVSLALVNPYPVDLTIPPLGFDVLVPNCASDEPYIHLADAMTETVEIGAKADVKVEVGGVVRNLPNTLTKACPKSHQSPLDLLLGDYTHGKDTTIFIRGSNASNVNTPDWISRFISSVTMPVPFPGHTFDNLIREFALKNVHFSLGDPFAEPNSPESNPQISGDIEVLAGLPKEMNFGVNVSRVRADADVFYHGKKLGVLNLHKWQNAKSKRIKAHDKEDAALRIESKIKNAPLKVTDDDVFSDVMQDLLFGGKEIFLKIDASVEVEVETVLGIFIIKDLPAEGTVPVKRPSSF